VGRRRSRRSGHDSKSIERAQKKVELNHFEGRKHVLQYDDVMNVQREVIYRERRRALLGGDLRDTVLDMTQQAALAEADKHCPRDVRVEEWDTHKLHVGLGRLFGATLLNKHLKADELAQMRNRDEIDDRLREVAEACYAEREQKIGAEHLREVERWQLTRTIDEYWMEHLAEMDYLRDAIWQEGYAQKEPIGVYRQEGFALFQKMLGEIRRTSRRASSPTMWSRRRFTDGPQMMGMQEARLLAPLPMDEDGADDSVQLYKDADGNDDEDQVMSHAASSFGNAAGRRRKPRHLVRQPLATRTVVQTALQWCQWLAVACSEYSRCGQAGRNHPCSCGSGKKYKNCCGKGS
jgi:preprotein translocase subunit SecA